MISFVSVRFLVFLAASYLLYFLVPMRRRWLVLLGASLYFYCCAGVVKMLFPLAAGAVAYATALRIAKIQGGGKADVYWRREPAERNYLKLLLYMLYFPQILQGPIPRHGRLAPQLTEGHPFQYRDLCYGLQRMGWGYFKKLVIANRFAMITREVFGNYASYEGMVFVVALICAAIELYCDFSGGMDIVLGVSEAFSIRLDENFRRPFFSRTVAEFWRRWHITLGAWFRDYVFMPLAASPRLIGLCQAARKRFGPRFAKQLMTVIPLAAVWLLTGLWHGTGLDYIAWGVYWGGLIILSNLYAPRIKEWNAELEVNPESRRFRAAQTARTFFLFLVSRLLTAPGDLGTSLEIAYRMSAVWNPGILFDGTLCQIGLDKPDLCVGVIAVLVLWEEAMEEKILKLLSEEYPDVDFASSEELVDDGILDSLTIIGIIAVLTMEFGITIPYEEIIEENFNSIAGLARMVERLQA